MFTLKQKLYTDPLIIYLFGLLARRQNVRPQDGRNMSDC